MNNINEEGRRRVEQLRKEHVISDEDLKRYKDQKLLEKYQNVVYRIEDEGVGYTFKNYSTFDEIEDKEFHKLRKYLIQHIDLMDFYLKKTINNLEKKIEEYD
jgi:hypothetical protein